VSKFYFKKPIELWTCKTRTHTIVKTMTKKKTNFKSKNAIKFESTKQRCDEATCWFLWFGKVGSVYIEYVHNLLVGSSAGGALKAKVGW
jgi:hypothetical protein